MPTDSEIRDSGKRQGGAHLSFKMPVSSAGKANSSGGYIQSYVWILGRGDAKTRIAPHVISARLDSFHSVVASGKSDFLLQFRVLRVSILADMEEIRVPFVVLLRKHSAALLPSSMAWNSHSRTQIWGESTQTLPLMWGGRSAKEYDPPHFCSTGSNFLCIKMGLCDMAIVQFLYSVNPAIRLFFLV